MREHKDIGKTLEQLQTLLSEYQKKVLDLKYDQTRFDETVKAIRALGYERWMAEKWLSSMVPKRC